MVQGKFRQDSLSFTSQCQQHFAAIVYRSFPADTTIRLKPIDQFNCAVMLQLHPVGKFSDPRPDALGHSLDRQHELVLLLFDARLAYRLLAEIQEFANLVAELSQGLIVRLAETFHTFIVSCRDKLSSDVSYYDILKTYHRSGRGCSEGAAAVAPFPPELCMAGVGLLVARYSFRAPALADRHLLHLKSLVHIGTGDAL